MGITIPDLPDADFNRELRIALVEDTSQLAINLLRVLSVEQLAAIQCPQILVQDVVTDRTKKISIPLFVDFLKKQVGSPEDLEDALFYLEGSLQYLPEGTMKRNIKRLLESVNG